MARPRIFVSSTFYDLKYVRDDLERFINGMGYEVVMNERGSVPYGRSEKLENFAYREIELCDIVVSIIGGRFGTQSEHSIRSISQHEVKTALDVGKQVYIFIEKNVSNEYKTYVLNKENSGIRYNSVDNPKIFGFIEEIKHLQNNNVIHEFESVNDITSFLREQWAGLFQRFLNEQTKVSQLEIIQSLRAGTETVNKLATYLSEKTDQNDQSAKEMLFFNHPAHQSLRKALSVNFRTFFLTKDEMEQFIRARRFEEVPDFIRQYDDWLEYTNDREKSYIETIWVYCHIFDDSGQLKIYNHEEWNSSYITIKRFHNEDTIDDDLPF